MKRLISLALLGLFFITVQAQNNNSTDFVNVPMRVWDTNLNRFVNPLPVKYEDTYAYKRNHVNITPQTGVGNTRVLTTQALGTAGNLFTIIDGQMNNIAVDNEIGTVSFIHRSDPSIFPSSNVAQYRYDVSYDGGQTWSLNNGVLNPKGNQLDLAGRFPQAVIHRPGGTTDSDSSYLAYFGPWLPFDNGGSWDGIFHGVARLDNEPTTWTENTQTPNNSDVYIPRGLYAGAPGIFWAVDWSWVDDGSGTVVDFGGILIYKGIWSDADKDVAWSLADTIIPPFDKGFDGTSQTAALNIAFDRTGQYGWIGFSSDLTAQGVAPDALYPSFYSTKDGGDTWEGPIVLDLGSFDNIVDGLTAGPDPTTAFDAGIAVDKFGNPHYSIVVGTEGTGSPYSITSGATAGMKLYSFTKIPGAPAGCEWQAIFIDTIATLRGDITLNVSEDNRPRVAIDPAGEKIFFSWLDSDPIQSGGTNDFPNFETKAYDVTTGLATDITNWTEGTSFEGGALFGTMSTDVFESAGTYSMAPVFTQLNASGLDEDPAAFFYGNGVEYTTADFTNDIWPPQIDLAGANPMTIESGNAYVEPGATAEDNVDGTLLQGALTIDASNVNTNTPGTYVVTYDVTDAAGNVACTAERVINVVASPDNTAPTITLTGDNPLVVDVCAFFADPGATASDDVDGDISGNVTATSTVVTGQTGNYTITYDVTDGAGNTATPVVRNVEIVDLAPEITVLGSNPISIEACNLFSDPGAFGFDNCIGNVTLDVVSTVDMSTAGAYTITYTADDGVNAPVVVVRNVNVTADVTPPTITAIGDNPTYVPLNGTFTDLLANAFDLCDQDISNTVQSDAGTSVDETTRGIYTVTYTVTDAAGNTSTTTRTVIVNTAPAAGFSFVVAGGTVAFTDESLYDPTDWTWAFGNGNGSRTQNPSHTYTANGKYEVCLTAENFFGDDTFCDSVEVFAVGIEEAVLEQAFDVFPNPTTGVLNIDVKDFDFDDLSLEVYNILGEQIQVVNYGAVTSGRFNLDLSGNANGIYMLKIRTNEGVVTKKINLFNN